MGNLINQPVVLVLVNRFDDCNLNEKGIVKEQNEPDHKQ